MIKNIVFDMGNVLINYDPRACLRRFADSEADSARLFREVFHSVEWVLGDRGAITDGEAIARICGLLPQRLHATVAELYAHWFEEMKPIPETEALARELKEKGYGLYLLSNAARSLHVYKDSIPALALMDGLFVSADWGLIKPELEIFRAFHARFGLVPAECFFIDDFPLNIEASIRAGMPGHIFDGDVAALVKALQEAGIRI